MLAVLKRVQQMETIILFERYSMSLIRHRLNHLSFAWLMEGTRKRREFPQDILSVLT